VADDTSSAFFEREDGKRRVLVEIRTRAGADLSAGAMGQERALSGVEIDTEYEPVPLPAPQGLAADLEAQREETVVVRAFVSEAEREALEADDAVVSVHDDVRIAPFCGDPTARLVAEPRHPAPRRELAPSDAGCAIPPCDCEPWTAKGALRDAARQLRADQVWRRGFRGKDIVVGVVDGGIDARGRGTGGTIPRVIGGWPKADWGTFADWGGHGNMCATDVLGMAPQAQIYDLRIADGGGYDFLSAPLAAFAWAIRQRKINGTPHVLSNSWGMFAEWWAPDYVRNPDHPFTRKVVEAIDLGIHVVFAAGNCGEACPDGRCDDVGPGKSIWGANGHERVMTIAAVNTHDEYIGYSSQGPAALWEHKPDFCASSHVAGYFDSDSGTSAACPIAAGVVALLKEAQPTLTPDHARKVLKATARNIGDPGWDPHSGSGVIDAAAALAEVLPQTQDESQDLAVLRSVVRSARRKPSYAQCLAAEVCGYGQAPQSPDVWMRHADRVNRILDAQPRFRGVVCRELRRAAMCAGRRKHLIPVVRRARRSSVLKRCLCREICGRGSAMKYTPAQRRMISAVRQELDRCPWTKHWFCEAIGCPSPQALEPEVEDDLLVSSLDVELDEEPEPLITAFGSTGGEPDDLVSAGSELALLDIDDEVDLLDDSDLLHNSELDEFDLDEDLGLIGDSVDVEFDDSGRTAKIVTTVYFPMD